MNKEWLSVLRQNGGSTGAVSCINTNSDGIGHWILHMFLLTIAAGVYRMAKTIVQRFKKSINESGFSSDEIAMIWEFYVTKAIAKSAEQRRTVADYNLKQLPLHNMLQLAGVAIENAKVLCANSINRTLANMDLQIVEGTGDRKQNKPIDIDICRIVCVTPYSIADEEKPKPCVGEAESILTHIRNSLAHGLTYFLDNGNVLFEDKDNRGGITARMIVKQECLLTWIELIDHEHRFYGKKAIEETQEKAAV